MAGFFVSASSQNLRNAAPSAPLDYPLSVGMWVNLTAVGVVTRTLWCLSDTGTTNNYLAVKMLSTEIMTVTAIAGGSAANATGSTALVAGTWNFFLGRFISATQRRSTTLHSSGLVESGNSTTSLAPTSMDVMVIGSLETSGGAAEFWGGSIAEYWVANIDVQADGLATNDAFARQLAFEGPFSVPRVAQNLVEYRSLRKSLTSDSDEAAEVYSGNFGPQTWTNTGATIVGPHPQLPYWHQNSLDFTRNVMV